VTCVTGLLILCVLGLALRLAIRADALEDSLVTVNLEAGLLFSYLARKNGNRYIDVKESTAHVAMDMVVPIDSTIEATRLITERKLLNESAFREQVKCSINRTVGHARVFSPHTLVDLACGHVAIRAFDLVENHRSLRRHPEVRVGCH
jgi:hypothetical protein